MVELGHFGAGVVLSPEVADVVVRYALIETRGMSRTFGGFASESQKKIIRVVNFWTGSTDTVFSEQEALLTSGDCLNLARTGKWCKNVMCPRFRRGATVAPAQRRGVIIKQ